MGGPTVCPWSQGPPGSSWNISGPCPSIFRQPLPLWPEAGLRPRGLTAWEALACPHSKDARGPLRLTGSGTLQRHGWSPHGPRSDFVPPGESSVPRALGRKRSCISGPSLSHALDKDSVRTERRKESSQEPTLLPLSQEGRELRVFPADTPVSRFNAACFRVPPSPAARPQEAPRLADPPGQRLARGHVLVPLLGKCRFDFS